MVGDTVVQLKMNLLAPICNICVVDAFYKHCPGMSVVGGGAFGLGIGLGVERFGY